MTRPRLLLALLVVAAGALAAGQPAVPAPRPSDFFDRRDSLERVKRVMLAVHQFADSTGKFPRDIVGKDGEPLLSWRVALLPHLDQDVLYGMFKLDEPWNSPANRQLLKHVPKVYRSPGAGAWRTRVKAVRGPSGFLDPAKPLTFTDFPDGTSNTVGVADTGADVEWTRPADFDVSPDKPLPDVAGPYSDGFAAGFVDGAARWVRADLPADTLRALLTRDGGEVNAIDVGPAAGAKPPLTDREKKYAATLRQMLERPRPFDQLWLDRRVAVTVALAKFGPVPLPPIPAADDLPALAQAFDDRRTPRYDHQEADRLLDLLKVKDPAAAAKIAAEFDERLQQLMN